MKRSAILLILSISITFYKNQAQFLTCQNLLDFYNKTTSISTFIFNSGKMYELN